MAKHDISQQIIIRALLLNASHSGIRKTTRMKKLQDYSKSNKKNFLSSQLFHTWP